MIIFLMTYVIPFVIIFSVFTFQSYLKYRKEKIDYKTFIETTSTLLLGLLYFMLLQVFFQSSQFGLIN